MDQGLAAVWAGLAGLGGAGIGGGAAVWGAWIAGRKAVEAAERAEQRAAVSEHGHWQRQARYEAYSRLIAIAEEVTNWGSTVPLGVVKDMSDRLRAASGQVQVLGTDEVIICFGVVLAVLYEASAAWTAAQTSGPTSAADTPVPWGTANGHAFNLHLSRLKQVVGTVLDAPPA